jgi:hypothetical protein
VCLGSWARATQRPHVEQSELDLHNDDPAFAQAAAATLLGLLGRAARQ